MRVPVPARVPVAALRELAAVCLGVAARSVVWTLVTVRLAHR